MPRQLRRSRLSHGGNAKPGLDFSIGGFPDVIADKAPKEGLTALRSLQA